MLKRFLVCINTLFFFCHCHSEELGQRGFFVDTAILYWKANESGLSFAVKSASIAKMAPHAKVENPDFEWDFGFKLGLGYRFPHDNWNLLVRLTSFQTHTDNAVKVGNNEVLFPLWTHSNIYSPFFAKEVKAHWRLHLGLVDLMLCKFYKATDSLFLIPEIGIRGGPIRQKYYLEYKGGSFAASGDDIIHMKNKFFGVGPNMGLLGQWSCGRGFSLFAKSLLSLLFGEFYVHQAEYSAKEKLLGVHDIFPSTAAIFEACAGIRWQCCFQGTLKKLALEVGWDQLFFFSQNQLLHFTNAQAAFFANQGDLAISGAEFNMRFDF